MTRVADKLPRHHTTLTFPFPIVYKLQCLCELLSWKNDGELNKYYYRNLMRNINFIK